MTNLTIDSLHLLLQIFSFVGIYSNKKKSTLTRIKSFVLQFWALLFVTSSFIPVLIDKTAREDNNTMMFLVEAISGSFKALPVLIIDERINKLIDFFGHKRFTWRNNQEKDFFRDCIKVCQRNSKLYVFILSAATYFWFLQPILFRQRKFPVELWLPYSTESNFAFYGTNFLIFIALGNLIVCELTEPLIGSLAYLAATQLRILKSRLGNLDKFTGRKIDEDGIIKFEELEDESLRCVALHKDIIYFVGEFETCFSWCVLCQIGGTTFGICYACLGLIEESAVNLQSCIYIGGISVFLYQIFFYCFYGTLLFEENSGIIEAIYMGPWYRYDVKTRKFLLIMMERSKKPMIVTAAKIVQLTLKTFTALLKSTYSLFAVLKQHYN